MHTLSATVSSGCSCWCSPKNARWSSAGVPPGRARAAAHLALHHDHPAVVVLPLLVLAAQELQREPARVPERCRPSRARPATRGPGSDPPARRGSYHQALSMCCARCGTWLATYAMTRPAPQQLPALRVLPRRRLWPPHRAGRHRPLGQYPVPPTTPTAPAAT
jgi:hypothetical protein